MDLIHGSDPWIRSMDQIHGSDPWIRIRSMDLNRKLARIGSHILCVRGNSHMFLLAPKTSFGRHVCLESAPILRPWLNLANVSPAQPVGWRRLFRVLLSTRILVKSLKTMNSMICENWDPFKKNEREALIKKMVLKRLGDEIRTISYQKFVFSMNL